MKTGTRPLDESLEAPALPLSSGLTLNKHLNLSLAPILQRNEENGRNGDRTLYTGIQHILIMTMKIGNNLTISL